MSIPAPLVRPKETPKAIHPHTLYNRLPHVCRIAPPLMPWIVPAAVGGGQCIVRNELPADMLLPKAPKAPKAPPSPLLLGVLGVLSVQHLRNFISQC